MDDDAVEDFGEDIYSAGVWPLSSPPFQSKSGGVVDGGGKARRKEKSRRKRGSKGPRGSARRRRRQSAEYPRALALTFNEAVRG